MIISTQSQTWQGFWTQSKGCVTWYFQKAEYNNSAFHKRWYLLRLSFWFMLIRRKLALPISCFWTLHSFYSMFLKDGEAFITLKTSCRLLPFGIYSAEKPHFWETFALTKSKAAVFHGREHGLQDLYSWTLASQPWTYHFTAVSHYMKWGWLHSWVVSLWFPYCILCVKIIFHWIDK